jgi:signal peptidase II
MLKHIKQPHLIFLTALIIVIIALDQLTKTIASDILHYAEPIYVLPVLNWTLLHNYGAAFSFLSDAGGWQRWLFTGISIVVSVVFMVWLTRLPKDESLTRYSLTFIIGGAIGNLIDRMQFGYVVDFILVHWQEHYFPAFNLADSAITLGAILMIIDVLFNPERHK